MGLLGGVGALFRSISVQSSLAFCLIGRLGGFRCQPRGEFGSFRRKKSRISSRSFQSAPHSGGIPRPRARNARPSPGAPQFTGIPRNPVGKTHLTGRDPRRPPIASRQPPSEVRPPCCGTLPTGEIPDPEARTAGLFLPPALPRLASLRFSGSSSSSWVLPFYLFPLSLSLSVGLVDGCVVWFGQNPSKPTPLLKPPQPPPPPAPG